MIDRLHKPSVLNKFQKLSSPLIGMPSDGPNAEGTEMTDFIRDGGVRVAQNV